MKLTHYLSASTVLCGLMYFCFKSGEDLGMINVVMIAMMFISLTMFYFSPQNSKK